MSKRFMGSLIALLALVAVLFTVPAYISAQGQTVRQAPPPPKAAPPPNWIDPRNPPKVDPNWKPPMTKDGHPDLQGQWGQSSDIITYSIEDPESERAEHTAISGQRTMVGRPIIDPIDGKIPYRPWAAKLAEFLKEQHVKPSKPEYLDPISRGFQEGIPRINYQGSFQITQFKDTILIYHEYGHAYRVIPINTSSHPSQKVKLWMGDSRGHWEGNTLVVDVANNNDSTWFQIVGSVHSDELRMTERWSLASPDHMVYVVTMEDPKVYTQPWKLRIDMRRQEPDEFWENAVWEGNMLGGLPPEFWGGAKAADYENFQKK
jgi:hypothetical protein